MKSENKETTISKPRPALKLMMFFSLTFFLHSFAHGASVTEVIWYPPEIESLSGGGDKGARLIVSGRTEPWAQVQVDGDSVTILKSLKTSVKKKSKTKSFLVERNCRVYSKPSTKSKRLGVVKKGVKLRGRARQEWVLVSSKKGRAYLRRRCLTTQDGEANSVAQVSVQSVSVQANAEGFFELALEVPESLVQVAIEVQGGKESKTYLTTFNVSLDQVKTTQKVTREKPPAAAKNIRAWLGSGLTFQTYKQKVATNTNKLTDIKFSNTDLPSLLARFGYWGESAGVDLFYRSAPGRIEEAENPFTLKPTDYEWTTLEIKGLYQFERGDSSRIFGLPSQWQLRFGIQRHQIPFLSVDATNRIEVQSYSLTTATLGLGLLLGQERTISYEFMLGLQYPVASGTVGGEGIKPIQPLAFEGRMGAAYKIATNWRLGLFAYAQYQSYKFKVEANGAGSTPNDGEQQLFYSTFDLRLGYEY